MDLGNARWPEVAERASVSLLAIPLGSTEQHGPHLPLSTDSDIALALANRLAEARPQVIVAPLLPYGSSGEHAGFAGTLSIGQTALELVVIELVRSADAFERVVLVSAHGGNAEPLETAVAKLRAEGRAVLLWSPARYRDAHAGHSETSVMLALHPARVHADAAARGAVDPISLLMPALRAGGVRSVSSNGVLGDPTGAAADEGHVLLDALTADLIQAVDAIDG